MESNYEKMQKRANEVSEQMIEALRSHHDACETVEQRFHDLQYALSEFHEATEYASASAHEVSEASTEYLQVAEESGVSLSMEHQEVLAGESFSFDVDSDYSTDVEDAESYARDNRPNEVSDAFRNINWSMEVPKPALDEDTFRKDLEQIRLALLTLIEKKEEYESNGTDFDPRVVTLNIILSSSPAPSIDNENTFQDMLDSLDKWMGGLDEEGNVKLKLDELLNDDQNGFGALRAAGFSSNR
jgi:hypothetical protein